MHRVIRVGPIGQMAASGAAIRGRDLQIVVVIDVALCARNRRVAVRKGEAGAGVIKRRSVPTCVVVAIGATCQRESLRGVGVRRIIGLLPSGEVAARVPAVRVRNALKIVVVVDVALRTRHRSVRAIQNESSHAMVEGGSQPAIKTGVTILAIGGRKGRAGAGVRRVVGLLPIGQMARLTVRRETIENSGRRLLVASFALDRRMGSEQWEAIEVILNLLNCDVPSLYGMALFAVLSQLVTVNVFVRMAVHAVLADVGENWLDVTLDALHFLVHAAQRILGFVVIEFGHCANRPPSCGSVAVLAGNIQ